MRATTSSTLVLSTNMYKQCTLKMLGTERYHHAWIPSNLAVQGKTIYLNGLGGRIHYLVVSAGKESISAEYMRELERDHLTQRRASDI